jgi:hypothetical protein
MDSLKSVLGDAAEDATLEAALLQALLACSLWPDSCAQLLQRGALRLVTALLHRHGCEPAARAQHGLLQTVVELLWNIAERAPVGDLEAALGAAECAAPAGRETCEAVVSTVGAELIATLGAVCGRLLRCANSRAAQELRNDALVALQHLCVFRECAAAAASSTRVSGDTALSVLALAAEAAGSATPQIEQPTRYLHELDVEVQLVAWGALSDAAEAHADCLAAVVDGGRLLPLLMAHAWPDRTNSGPCGSGSMRDPATRLAPEHRAALRRAAWSALLRIAPRATAPFLETCSGGMGLVTCLLETGGPGGGDDESSAVAEAAARLVQRLCRGSSGSSKEAAAALTRYGAVGALLQQVSSAGAAERTSCAALLALTALCAAGGAESRKLLRSGRGVGVLVAELER